MWFQDQNRASRVMSKTVAGTASFIVVKWDSLDSNDPWVRPPGLLHMCLFKPRVVLRQMNDRHTVISFSDMYLHIFILYILYIYYIYIYYRIYIYKHPKKKCFPLHFPQCVRLIRAAALQGFTSVAPGATPALQGLLIAWPRWKKIRPPTMEPGNG